MTLTIEPPGLCGCPLDRLDHIRQDPDRVTALAQAPSARILHLDGLEPVLAPDGSLGWLPMTEAPADRGLGLLGALDGMPRFVALPAAPLPRKHAMSVIPLIERMPDGDAATYATARSLVDWHARHRFCAVCGSPTQVQRGGWARRCGECAAEHFPRTDPVVIMLAEHDDRVLVGRQPAFPPGLYSALAGFVEVGESIEDAVACELFEEAGVRATSVRYIASQPWPFPSSLMIGAIATVADDRLTIDTTELEEAIWLTRAEVEAIVRNQPGARFRSPMRLAIAHTLLKRWVAGA